MDIYSKSGDTIIFGKLCAWFMASYSKSGDTVIFDHLYVCFMDLQQKW